MVSARRLGAIPRSAPHTCPLAGENSPQAFKTWTLCVRFLSPGPCFRDSFFFFFLTSRLYKPRGFQLRPNPEDRPFIRPPPPVGVLAPSNPGLPTRLRGFALASAPASKSLFNIPHCPAEHKDEKLGRGRGSGGHSQQSGPSLRPARTHTSRARPEMCFIIT